MRFCEQLEQRALLSGNVVASVVNGQLFIRGDAGDNAIHVTADPATAGAVLVSGEHDTTINGQPGPLSLTGIRHLNIKLGAGDNQATIEGLSIARNLSITSGNGADRFRVIDTSVGGRLWIMTRGGDDQVELQDVAVNGWTRIDTGGGNDIITADASTFRGHFALLAGRGNDTVFLNDSLFLSRKRINAGPGKNQVNTAVISRSFDFGRGHQGWRAGYTDYHVGMEPSIAFRTGVRPLPPELGRGSGYLLSSKNVSDDVFQYIYRELDRRDGIRPNQTYRVQFTIRFASNAGSNLVGIGGAPGESVFLKAGASASRPRPVVGPDGYVSSSIDHGNQAQGGSAVSVVGHIANGNEDVVDGPYVSITRQHVHTALVRSDARGRLYLVVGTDSGFEGQTAIYIQQVSVKLMAVNQPGQERPPVVL
jgi:hypothetical protein